MEDISLFNKWALKYNLKCETNKQTFPFNTFYPEFIINDKIYIDIYEDWEISEDYFNICEAFKNRHGIIIMIPIDGLSELFNYVTPEDIENKFDIKF